MGPGGEGPAEPPKAFPPRDSSDSAAVLSLRPRGRCLDGRLCSYGSESPRGERVALPATRLTPPLARVSATSDQDLPELRIGRKAVSLRRRARKLRKDCASGVSVGKFISVVYAAKTRLGEPWDHDSGTVADGSSGARTPSLLLTNGVFAHHAQLFTLKLVPFRRA